MRAQVRKWGNSAALRIPAAVMEAASLKLDQAVDVREENGRIVIEPVNHAYDLDQLVAAITPDNLPDDVDFGPSIGEEVW